MTTLLRAGLTLALALSAGCDREPAVDRSPYRFPGFTQAGGQGEAADYYYETATIHRNARGWLEFRLSRLVSGGYLLLEATTDCRANVRLLDGTRHRDDGTLETPVAAEVEPVDFRDQPALAAVVTAVCGRFEEKRSLADPFDDIKAMELLYGPYRPELRGAVDAHIEAPADSAGAISFAGKPGVARVLASAEFIERGQTKHVLLTGTQVDGDGADCRACGQLIGAAVFAKVGHQWKLEADYPALDVLGLRGQAPRMSWQRIGHDRYAAVAELADQDQGIASVFIGVYELADAGWRPLLEFSEEGRRGESVEASIAFGDPNQAYADALVTVKGDKSRSRQERLLFADGAYARPKPVPAFVGPVLPPVAARNLAVETTVRKLLENYAAAVNSGDVEQALGFWAQPSRKLRKILAETRGLSLDVQRVDVDANRATAWVILQGQGKRRAGAPVRGGMDLIPHADGEWRIAGLAPFDCKGDCDFPPPRNTSPEAGASAKAAVRAYFAALPRHDSALQGRELLRVNRIGDPVVKDGKGRVWVELALKGRSGVETWQGSVRLQTTETGWIVTDASGLTHLPPKPKPKPKAEVKPKTAPDSRPRPEDEPDPNLDRDGKPMPPVRARSRPAPEPVSPADSRAKPRPEAKAKPATDPKTKPGASPDPKAKTGAGAKPETGTKPAADAKPKPKTKPAARPAPAESDEQPYRRPPAEDEPDPNIP